MVHKEYDNFDLTIERVGETYRARIDSPGGHATVEFSLPFFQQEVERLLSRISGSQSGMKRQDMEQIKQFGEQLFDAIFDREAWGCFRNSLHEAQTKAGLRIRLRIEAPELVNIPWEYLYHLKMDHFLALSVKTPMVRYISLPDTLPSLKVNPPLQVLVVLANPINTPPLDVEEEWKKLKKTFAKLEKQGLVALSRLEKATFAALQKKLRSATYHILHFIGHGDFDEYTQDGLLLLEGKNRQAHRVSAEQLGQILGDHDALRLVLLNACEGARTSHSNLFAGTAQSLIQQSIPAVIAMQSGIWDKVAIILAHEFYHALADGEPVDTALTTARKTLFARYNSLQWGIPVLYMRAQDGHLFDIVMETDASPQPKRRLSPRIIILLTVVNLMLLTLGTFALGLFRPPATPTSAEERSSSLSIAIAPFDGCPNVSDDLTEALEQHFADSLSVQKRASEAPDDRAREDLSLFISGSCDQNGEVTSKFELLEEIREVPELYHPRTLSIEESDQNANTSSSKRLADALIFYLRREHNEAAQAFKALIGFVPIDTESQLPVALYLLRGNALLFMKQDQEAEAWLKQAIEKVVDADDNRLMANMLSLVANDEILVASDTMLARLHHHLAIAQLNIGWSTGDLEHAIDNLRQSIAFEAEFGLPYANLGRTLRWKGTYLGDPDKSAPIYDDAATACQQALALSNPNETSTILAKVCLVEIEVERYHLSITDQPASLKQQLNQLQMENVSSWSTTLFVTGQAYCNIYRYSEQEDEVSRQIAAERLEKYLEQSEDEIVLSYAQDNRELAKGLLRDYCGTQ